MKPMQYQTAGGELKSVFPGGVPTEPCLCFCEESAIKPDMLNDQGVLVLEKFSRAVRDKYKPRIVVDTTKKPLRIAICGNKDAGKDRLAQCVKSMMPPRSVEVASISKHALLPLMLQTLHGTNCAIFGNYSYEVRDLCRPFWFDAGASITSIDPSFLIRYAVRERDDLTGINAVIDSIRSPSVILVTGVRGENELDAALSEGLIDFSVYVTRRGTADVTNHIKPDKTDVVFNNSGSVHDMRERVSRLVRSLLPSVE